MADDVPEMDTVEPAMAVPSDTTEIDSDSMQQLAQPIDSAEMQEFAPVVGVQVAANEEVAQTDDGADEADINTLQVLELGDRVLIDSKRYGRIVGRIYFRSADLIRILPDGVSDRLYDFPRTYTDTVDEFAEELGVEASYVLEKRKLDSFVEQQDIRVGQRIETLTANGEQSTAFTVIAVRTDDDEIDFEDNTGATGTIDFGFEGIPLEESFAILRIREQPKIEEAEGEADSATVGEQEEAAAVEEEVLEKPKIKVRVSGYVELPKVAVYREAKQADKVYSDIIQKVDALNDFLNMLDPAAQKDPKSIRLVRILVETLFNMKNALVAYNMDGSIRGTNDISVKTVSQLLEKVNVPLGRAVLNVSKRIYQSPDDDELDITPTEKTDDTFLISFNREYENIVSGASKTVSNTIQGAQAGQGVSYWIKEQSFINDFMRPWLANSTMPPIISPKVDMDFFRRHIPDIDNASIPGGWEPSRFTDVEKNYPIPTDIYSSQQRALGVTYRKGADKRKQVLVPSEDANMSAYLLFPLEAARSVGTTRSGSLAIDSGRSLEHIETMMGLLQKLGGVQEVTTTKGILAIGASGNTLGNIPLRDYLEGISIPALGFGDADNTFVELGLDKLEMTPEILQILETKIKAYQNQLLVTIHKLREALASITKDGNGDEAKVNDISLLDTPEILESVIRSEPILVEDMRNFEIYNHNLADSDIAQVAYLLRKHADYFQVAAGQQSVYTARERIRAARDMFIESLRIAKILRNKAAESGERPSPCRCKGEHPALLRTIRKIHDEQERYRVLTKFFAKFQGSRDDNWINCNQCKENLLCVHERLQIQAFLSPREKDQIQKEIILNFADGVFQGNYICRNCGQPIQELGFDTHIEYDDDGRPMMGRAVLVDKDALRKEEIDAALGAPVSGPSTDITFDTETESAYARTIKEIAERIGISLDRDAYKRIIRYVHGFMNKLPDRKTYSKIQKKQAGLPDYDVAASRNTVCACAIFLLVEIQTRIPDYIVRFALPGCVASFAGSPLGAETDKRGIQYIACAVASIVRDDAPWNLTGFQGERQDKKRQDIIQRYMEGILRDTLKSDVTLEQTLQDKRIYVKETFGAEAAEGKPSDSIPADFLPEQLGKPGVIIPEVVAHMEEGGDMMAKMWILQAQQLAKKTSSLIRNSPFIDATCCVANIEHPGSFWQAASDLPKLQPRKLVSALLRNSTLKVHFSPRRVQSLLVETPEDLTYRLFLKVCFQGPRKGLSHEPGLTNICPWCGFEFPGHPSVIDTDTEGKSALLSQNVETSKQDFQALLDTVHLTNRIPEHSAPKLIGFENTMAQMSKMEPEPIENWPELLEETLRGFRELPGTPNRGDIAIALGALSDAIVKAEENVKRRVTRSAQASLDTIAGLSWGNFFQSMKAYFIVPFQRLIVGFDQASLFIPKEMKLSGEHWGDITKILETDQIILKAFGGEFKFKKSTTEFAKHKLQHFLKQMSKITEFQNKIRAVILPGGSLTLNYIQRAFLYGPLSQLVDPNIVPASVEGGMDASRAILDTSVKLLLNLIVVSVGKMMKERLSYDNEQLRELIAARNEKEKINIIQYFEKMTDEERGVEMVMKRLGMGRWAVGGTAAIRVYDADQYEREKDERAQAGILDFPGQGPDDVVGVDGRQYDSIGLPVENDTYYEEFYGGEGGYDNAQVAEDDY